MRDKIPCYRKAKHDCARSCTRPEIQVRLDKAAGDLKHDQYLCEESGVSFMKESLLTVEGCRITWSPPDWKSIRPLSTRKGKRPRQASSEPSVTNTGSTSKHKRVLWPCMPSMKIGGIGPISITTHHHHNQDCLSGHDIMAWPSMEDYSGDEVRRLRED